MNRSKRPALSLSKGFADLLILGVLAIVGLVAAVYFLFGQSFMAPATNLFMSDTPIKLPFAIPTASNDITSLEKEINTTEFNSIDSDLTNLEKELNSALTE